MIEFVPHVLAGGLLQRLEALPLLQGVVAAEVGHRDVQPELVAEEICREAGGYREDGRTGAASGVERGVTPVHVPSALSATF